MTSSPTRPRRLALHACCGPCLLEPLDALARESDEVGVVFFNPNIDPAEEYVRRRDALVGYTAQAGIDVAELPYDRAAWEAAVAPLAEARTERCRACYRLRLTVAARYAAENGFDTLATTMTVSPYQNHDAINEEGRRAARGAGVSWLERDYRDRYRDAIERSRALGMYRQNHCGCVYSRAEAEVERQARRAARAAEKAARHVRASEGSI